MSPQAEHTQKQGISISRLGVLVYPIKPPKRQRAQASAPQKQGENIKTLKPLHTA
jgi:hypothetical protein